jgi:hypothetical protein
MELTNINFDELLKGTQEPITEQEETLETTEIDFNLNPDKEGKVNEEEGQPKETEEEPKLDLQLNSDSPYDVLVQDFIESGEWNPEHIIEDEEGNEIKLSDLKGLDKETFQSLKQMFEEEKQKETKDKYVSIDGLSETQKALINIVKSGDLEKAEELFKNPQQLVEPFQGYDSTDDSHNEMVLREYYKYQGFNNSKIEALIKVAKEGLTLDSEAETIVTQVRATHKQQLLNIEKEAAEKKRQEEENRKVYRKEVATKFKEDFNLPDTLVKKLVDATTKPEADGELLIDKVFENLMKDPKEATEVALFLLNREEYKNRIKAPVKKEEQLNIAKKFKLVKDTQKTAKTQEDTKSDNFWENITLNT